MPKSKSSVSKLAKPPSVGAPAPPKGFSPPPNRRAGVKATEQQVRDAADVAREITKSPANYKDDFGKRAPDASALSQALVLAQAWSREADASDAWNVYVHTQRDAAWDSALAQLKQLEPEFKLAAAHDPAVGKRYPQTQSFLGARSAISKRAAAVRAKNKKAKPAPSTPTGGTP